jgi:hypothetical protein
MNITKTKPKSGVTGRDGYIIRQALAYAIKLIEALPADRQEYSNMCDMIQILRHLTDERERKFLAFNVSVHAGDALQVTSLPFRLADGVDLNEIMRNSPDPYPDPDSDGIHE